MNGFMWLVYLWIVGVIIKVFCILILYTYIILIGCLKNGKITLNEHTSLDNINELVIANELRNKSCFYCERMEGKISVKNSFVFIWFHVF